MLKFKSSSFLILIELSLLFGFFEMDAQSNYFPPIDGDQWDTYSLEDVGWCEDKVTDLLDWLEVKETEMFMVLKDGKMVIEQYFGNKDMESSHVWNSAGKSLMSFLVGIAQQEHLLNIDSSVAKYLGTGWTSLDSAEESFIKVRHQLSMTTGLDENEFACTDPNCLEFVAPVGHRWAYHNAPYTLLRDVVQNASGQGINVFTFQNIMQQTGMTGLWLPLGYYNIFSSTARSMARFGLLMMNEGAWDQDTILFDKQYFNMMTNPSQEINDAYGYLWWLNGSESFMLPGSQTVFGGSIAPSAPEDMIVAAGKNGQFLDILPSENIVIVRMGGSPDNTNVPLNFNDELVSKVLALECIPTSAYESNLDRLKLYPNPFSEVLNIEGGSDGLKYDFFQSGKLIMSVSYAEKLDMNRLESGIYFCRISKDGIIVKTEKLIKHRN